MDTSVNLASSNNWLLTLIYQSQSLFELSKAKGLSRAFLLTARQKRVADSIHRDDAKRLMHPEDVLRADQET
ncbi:hypothetical protein FRB91_006051 [Serendipita sp. 411]|nr:hypothetical protein FRB91_006051 [Serendipita sp. 411]